MNLGCLHRASLKLASTYLSVIHKLVSHKEVMPESKFCTSTLFVNEKQTQLYAQFRPHYTEEIYSTIVAFCKEGHCDFKLAVDIGCGSGQSTIPLSKYFNQVIGVDVSENQIANATQNVHNVSFKVGPAEKLNFVESESADLVTVAQALHWLDFNKFFAEVHRILKPGGSFVTYGYCTCSLEPKQANSIVAYYYSDVLKNYWPEGRKFVEEKYMSFVLPFPDWKREDRLTIVKECTVEEFMGYMGSWSAVNEYNKAHPEENLLNQAQQRLQSACLADKCKKPIKATWPVFMLMGHKPI